MELFDTHAHVQFPDYEGDRVEMFDRARTAGVRTMMRSAEEMQRKEARKGEETADRPDEGQEG